MGTILLKDVKIVRDGEVVEGNILVEGDTIRAVGKRDFQAERTLRCSGRLVVPGGVDIHAHVYDPAYESHEDWKTGSLAAAFGGVTLVVDMPLRTYVDSLEVLEKKLNRAKTDSYVNYGVTGGFLDGRNYDKVFDLVKRGVRTFKSFTCRPFQADEKSFPKILEAVANANAILIVHAEDEGLINYWEEKYREQKTIVAYHMSRTGATEAAAIMRVGYYAMDTLAKIHIAHLSSSEGVAAVSYLKNRGVKLTAEVTPHHLHFTVDDIKNKGNYMKVAPTIKTREDRDALWKALASGVIDVYASDNAPSPREKKEVDVWEAWGGIPSLEIMGPYLYTYGVMQNKLSLKRFVEVFSENPARLLRLYPLIGAIQAGSLANLYVLETRKTVKMSATIHHHKVDWTPWEGMELYGRPYLLIVNGEVIIEDGELVGKPGHGYYIEDIAMRLERP